ncbi:MAG: hypothetical protein LBF55_05645 [Prevotellaceae bacterium]|jgi:hypothetical protein|nr:hypothetical protein [Prevotellaceae bacterium]
MNEILTIDVSTAQARASLYRRLQTDAALRGEARRLSVRALGQEVGGCIDCVIDAIIQIQLKYKQKGKSIMEAKPYAIRAGAVINDVLTFDAGKVLTAASCTEELALYHLHANPACRKFFSRLPDDVDERIRQYAARNAAAQDATGATDATDATGATAAAAETGANDTTGATSTAASTSTAAAATAVQKGTNDAAGNKKSFNKQTSNRRKKR